MEENTNSTIPFYFPKEYKSIVSIIGIGGGAGRIVNEMQVHEFLKRYLYVFDMYIFRSIPVHFPAAY